MSALSERGHTARISSVGSDLKAIPGRGVSRLRARHATRGGGGVLSPPPEPFQPGTRTEMKRK